MGFRKIVLYLLAVNKNLLIYLFVALHDFDSPLINWKCVLNTFPPCRVWTPISSPRFLFLLYVIIGFLTNIFLRLCDICKIFQFFVTIHGDICCKLSILECDSVLFFSLVKSSCFLFVIHFSYLFIYRILGVTSFLEFFCNDLTIFVKFRGSWTYGLFA